MAGSQYCKPERDGMELCTVPDKMNPGSMATLENNLENQPLGCSARARTKTAPCTVQAASSARCDRAGPGLETHKACQSWPSQAATNLWECTGPTHPM